MTASLVFLVFMFVMIVVGYIFSLYLFSRRGSGKQYSGYNGYMDEYIEYSDNRAMHNARAGLIILLGGVIVMLIVAFMLFNTVA